MEDFEEIPQTLVKTLRHTLNNLLKQPLADGIDLVSNPVHLKKRMDLQTLTHHRYMRDEGEL